MSNKRSTGLLHGYGGPFHTPMLEKLHDRIYGEHGVDLDAETLWRIKRGLPRAVDLDRTVTSDRYAWFWAFFLETETGGQIVLALPWGNDTGKRDGTRSDRLSAVYARGEVSGVEIDANLESVLERINALFGLPESEEA